MFRCEAPTKACGCACSAWADQPQPCLCVNCNPLGQGWLLQRAAPASSTGVQGTGQCKGQDNMGQGPTASPSFLRKPNLPWPACVHDGWERVAESDELFPDVTMGTFFLAPHGLRWSSAMHSVSCQAKLAPEQVPDAKWCFLLIQLVPVPVPCPWGDLRLVEPFLGSAVGQPHSRM